MHGTVTTPRRLPFPIDSEAIFVQAFDNAPIGMALVDVGGRMLAVNPAFATMLGRAQATLAGETFASITHPDDTEDDVAQFEAVIAGASNGYRLYKRYLHAAGTVVEAHLSVTATRDTNGTIQLLVAQVEDVTERRANERRLREDAARLSLAVEALQGGFWHMDIATARFETSPKLSAFVEADRTAPFDLAGYSGRIAAEDLPAADLSPLIEGKVERCSAEYRVGTSAGPRWVRCDRRLIRDAQGRPERIVGVVIDVNEERKRRLQSQAEADTDALTGLLNRRGLDRHLATADATGSLGVLAIDLDRFKRVNDTHGHATGDVVLAECARRLRAQARGTDVVARLGGDEFVVLVRNIDERALAVAAERLSRALEQPVETADAVLRVGGSVGAAWSPHGRDAAALLAAADRALYRVKEDGRGFWRMAG